jgi:hypothetical protein
MARWAVVVVIFFFIGRSLALNWDELQAADLHFDAPLLLISMALLAVWMLGQALIWHLLTITSQVAIPLPKALAAWFYSQLGKYLPGKVFLYLGRLHFYVREGRPIGPVTVAFGVETIGNFASAIFTVLVAVLTVDAPALDPYRWALGAALVALLIALHPRVIGWLIAIAARVLHRRAFEVTLTYPQLLRYLGLYVVNWLLFGVALYVFIRSFYPLELSSILYLTGAFSFAGMMGIIAVFAPSGLGVREGILALFLGQVMPVPVALVVSVASRVWLTIIELGSAGLVYLMIRYRWIDAGDASTLELGDLGSQLDGGVEGSAQ